MVKLRTIIIVLAVCSSVVSKGQATFTCNQTIGIRDWTTPSSWTCSGNCSGRSYPGEGSYTTDAVVINARVRFYAGSTDTEVTIGSLVIDAAIYDASLLVNSARKLTISTNSGLTSGGVLLKGSGANYSSRIQLFGVGSEINVEGDFAMQRSALMGAPESTRLDVGDNAYLNIKGNFTYDYDNITGGTETASEIVLGTTGTTVGTIVVSGDLVFNVNSSVTSSASLLLSGTSQMIIAGNAFFNLNQGGLDQSLTVFLSDDISDNPTSDSDVSVDGAASLLHIKGNCEFNLYEDEDQPDIRLYVRGNSELRVDGALSVNNLNENTSSDATDILFKVTDNGKITCGNLTLTSIVDTSSPDSSLGFLEDAVLEVGGDINLVAGDGAFISANPNTIDFYGNSGLVLTGNVKRDVPSGSNADGRIEFFDNSFVHFKGSVERQVFFNTYNTSGLEDTYEDGSLSCSVYRNVLIQNSTGLGLSLDHHVAIYGHLDMTEGIIKTTDSGYVILASTSSANTGNNNSYIDGPVRKYGDQDIIIPIGRNSRWAPVELSNVVVEGGGYDGSVFPDLLIEYSDAGSGVSGTDGSIGHVSILEFWSVLPDPEGTLGVSADIDFHWKDACLSEIDFVDLSPQDLYMAYRTDADWGILPSSIDAASEGCDADVDSEAGFIKVSGAELTSVLSGDPYLFTFASLYGSNPLPVELVDFNVKQEGRKVLVSWNTVSETENDSFTVERSTDGSVFKEIGSLNGNGNSTDLKSYYLYDLNPVQGLQYYRLKQTDFNGNFEYSGLESFIFNDVATQNQLVVYPVPTVDNLQIEIEEEGDYVIGLFNSLSQKIYAIESHIERGVFQLSIKETGVTPGIYFLKITHQASEYVTRILIK